MAGLDNRQHGLAPDGPVDDASFHDDQRAEHEASIHPVTLRISPSSLEREFWRACTPAFAVTDYVALPIGIANICFFSRSALVAMLPHKMAEFTAWCGPTLLVSAAAFLCLQLAPRRFYAVRARVALALRLLRSAALIGMTLRGSSSAWGQFLEVRANGRTPWHVVAEVLALFFNVGLMLALVVPSQFVIAAPLQLAFSLALFRCSGPATCAVHGAEEFMQAARQICRQSLAVKGAALILGGALPAADATNRQCEEGPMAALLPLSIAAACFCPLYILYMRERRLRQAFLDDRRSQNARAHRRGGDASSGSPTDSGSEGITAVGPPSHPSAALEPAAPQVPPVMHASVGAALVLACFAASELAAWSIAPGPCGWPCAGDAPISPALRPTLLTSASVHLD